jgi:hypothetical protein
MSQETLASNPFMMMLNPEVVLAAIERSEKLGRLNSRMCHPLDKPVPTAAGTASKDGQQGQGSDREIN